MGRRSRKRGEAPAPAPGATQQLPRPRAGAAGPPRPRAGAAAPPRAHARTRPERPRPPWHPVPLTELCVLAGLVLLVWGLIRRDDPAGRVLLVCGMALGSLGGLETALRDHFTGTQSHSILLATLPAVLAAGVLFFARAPWIAIPVCAALVFAAAFTALRRAHRRVAPPRRLR